jgi:hypothetical protein
MEDNRKICTRCGEEKAAFLFLPGSDICKQCKGAYKKKFDYNEPFTTQIKEDPIMYKKTEVKIKNAIELMREMMNVWTEWNGQQIMKKTGLTTNQLAMFRRKEVFFTRQAGQKLEYLFNPDLTVNDNLINELGETPRLGDKVEARKKKQAKPFTQHPEAPKKVIEDNTLKAGEAKFTSEEFVMLLKLAKDNKQNIILQKLIATL